MKNKFPSKPRFGVLTPASNFIPFLANDMLAAFEFGLKQARLEAEIIIEMTGYNADLRMLTPAIQKLLLTQQVNCIIAPLNVSRIEKISGFFENQNVPIIALNLTEDPLFETARNNFVFVNSFYLWQTAWLCGYEAVKRFGPNGVIIVALHEGGYGLSFAFQLGLEAAQGNLLQFSVTHRDSSTEDPTPCINEVVAQKPDFIWAAYSGKEAVSFLAAYTALGIKDQIPLITLPTTITSHTRRQVGDSLIGTWYITAGEEKNKAENSFAALTEELGSEPNPYSLLSFESANLIAAAIEKTNGTEDFAADFPEALRQAEFQSYRGLVRFNNDANENIPFYLRQVTSGGDNLVEQLEVPALLHEQYSLARRKFMKEGWVNPYLCA